MQTNQVIETEYNGDLVTVLQALRVPCREGRPSNGRAGTILVPFDTELDGRLEGLIDTLAGLRWRYEPGRSLQLAFDLRIGEV